ARRQDVRYLRVRTRCIGGAEHYVDIRQVLRMQLRCIDAVPHPVRSLGGKVLIVADRASEPLATGPFVGTHLVDETELFEVVLAGGPAGGFAGAGQGRQQNGRQNSDDGDNDQQFNEGKPSDSSSHWSGLLCVERVTSVRRPKNVLAHPALET